MMFTQLVIHNVNINDVFCANVFEDEAQARQNQRIQQSSNHKQCPSRRRMDEGVRKVTTIGSIAEIGF